MLGVPVDDAGPLERASVAAVAAAPTRDACKGNSAKPAIDTQFAAMSSTHLVVHSLSYMIENGK
eukprot:4908084-Amphidinium_carterae.1